MKLVMLAVRDSAANAFNRPFFVQTVGLGVRSFRDEVNRSESGNTMYEHPEDFELFELGTYDEDTAIFECLPQPRSVARASDMKG